MDPNYGNIPSILFGLLVWSDKLKISPFGTVKGYPIVVWVLALLRKVQNAHDYGGTGFVGWLPVVCGIFLSLILHSQGFIG